MWLQMMAMSGGWKFAVQVCNAEACWELVTLGKERPCIIAPDVVKKPHAGHC